MRIVEIYAASNGSHRNQNMNSSFVPDGWAVVPDEMVTENFPFGDLTAEEIDGIMTVTSWIPGVVPEPLPEPEPVEPEPTVWDELDAAYREGVDSV